MTRFTTCCRSPHLKESSLTWIGVLGKGWSKCAALSCREIESIGLETYSIFFILFFILGKQDRRVLQIWHEKAESFLDYVLQCVLLLFLRFTDFIARDYQHMPSAGWKTSCVWYAWLASFLLPFQISFDGERQLGI